MILVKSSCSKYATMLSALVFISIRAETDDELIYILQWTRVSQSSWDSWSFWYLETGQKSFVSRNCSYQNCFITPDRTYLDNILDFDVLLFNIVDIRNPHFLKKNMPSNRSESQLYVFVASEPAVLAPISSFYNGFFNFTWTYRFESDIFHPFFVVKNSIGEVIGPKPNVTWLNYKYLAPTNKSIIRKLHTKRVAAVWVTAACREHPNSNFIHKLINELSKYDLQIHHFGRCGQQHCPRSPSDRLHLLTNCYKKIESDYYFYLAFEKYFAEDYVTEKVLHGLHHFLVPIVLGGANYARFLPYGSYLDALKLGPEKLAIEMYDIINNPPRYYDFFRWHGYYSFQDTTDNDHRETICEFCAFLNNEINKEKVGHIQTNISNWFNTVFVPDAMHSFAMAATATTRRITAATNINPATHELSKDASVELNSKDNIFLDFISNLLDDES